MTQPMMAWSADEMHGGPNWRAWVSRILDCVLLLATAAAALAVLVGGSSGPTNEITASTAALLVSGLIWVTLGLLWAGVRCKRIRRAGRGDESWRTRLAGGRVTRLITGGTAIIVLHSGLNIIVWREDDGVNAAVIRVVSMGMVLLAWTVLQLGYAERYARMEFENDSSVAHFGFPATERPSLLEYAYLSFSIGSAFSAPDVSVQTSRMRGMVMCHGLLSFVYNTAVLGMVLSLISG